MGQLTISQTAGYPPQALSIVAKTALSLRQTQEHSLAPLLSGEGNNIALNVADKWRGLTPARARESAQVSALTKLDRATANDAAEALANLLSFTANLFNIGKNMNDVQVGLLADDMLERYWSWRFDEFAYVLKEAVGGRWGTTYDRIDAATVHGWCQKYEAQRTEQLEADAERKHKAHRLAEANREKIEAEAMELLYFKAKLAAMSDEQLLAGIRFYEAHPAAPHAEIKIDAARDVLAERVAWAEHERSRPRTATEDAAGLSAAKEAWLVSRAMQQERDAREKQDTYAEEVNLFALINSK